MTMTMIMNGCDLIHKCSEFDISSLDVSIVKTRKCSYVNVECSFDIETSSVYVDDEYGAFMYEWAFGIHDHNFVCYGRTWDEFIELCKKLQNHFNLSESNVLICYVHNLSFEFQFMRKYFKWLNVFAVDSRKPIKCLCSYGIEFRDSYILSGYSLAKTAEHLHSHSIQKLKGDLDYSLVRTHLTPLTDDELNYCFNDVVIVLYYINEQMEQYGDIVHVPLTNTGRVRRYVRECCYIERLPDGSLSKRKSKKYRDIMKELVIQSSDEYRQLHRAFQGGFTHANASYSGQLLKQVSSIDFTSSYPAVMLSEKFPMGKAKTISNEIIREKGLDFFINHYCVLFDVRFKGIQLKDGIPDCYLSESKRQRQKNESDIDMITNNGRVYYASEFTTTLTDIDYRIIKRCYTWEKMGVTNVRVYERGYLPKDILLAIIKLYEDKTTLKGVEGKEVEYLNSKGMLNSVYGMSVTDIVRDEITYENDEWGINICSDSDVEEQLTKYNETWSRFLFYPWGVWVTAYARKNLWDGIINIGSDYIYSDTDSIKFLHHENHLGFIEAYNRRITKKLQHMCDRMDIPFDRLQPKTIKGVTKLIGVWDYEGTYSHFKTLGAKRYLYVLNGEFHITVAGLGKQDGANYLLETCGSIDDAIEQFNDDMEIPKGRTGKNTHTYIDDEMEFDIVDYLGNKAHIISKSGTHLEPSGYVMSLNKNYLQFLNMLSKGYIFKGVKEL